jgi:magnesium transporter
MDHNFNQKNDSLPSNIKIAADASYPQIFLTNYNSTEASRIQIVDLKECQEYLEQSDLVTWIDIQGFGSAEILQQIMEIFKLDPLLLEYMVNVPQRPRVEDFDDILLLIFPIVVVNSDHSGFISTQVSFILGKHYLLSLQEHTHLNIFQNVAEHLHNNLGKIRQKGADYLLSTLLDTVLDHFDPLLSSYKERLDLLSNLAIFNPDSQVIQNIYYLKQELFSLSRIIVPQRKKVNLILRDRFDLFSPDVSDNLRDCRERMIEISDRLDNYHHSASSLIDVYVSSINNRMSNTMNLLTIVLSIFSPLSFIVGLYGMNFNSQISPYNMPELNWYFGYPMVLIVMALVVIGMVILLSKVGAFKFLKLIFTNQKLISQIAKKSGNK